MDYFSSDFHLGHTNILRYDNRDFKSIRDHDEYILNVCRNTLTPKDNFYYLGDFAYRNNQGDPKDYFDELAKIGCNLYFVKGNHDHRDTVTLFKKYGTYLGEKCTIKLRYKNEPYQVILDHFANRIWNRSHHGSFHLYGHSHDKLEHEPWGRSMDVGIMSAFRINGDYSLFSFEQIHGILSARPIKLVGDHHGL